MARGARDVVGVDAQLAALTRARRILDGEPLEYGRRIVGRHYASAGITLPPSETQAAIEIVCADAMDPPLVPGSFDRVVAVNLIDAVVSPPQVIAVADGLCAPGGELILASPYAWQSGIVADEHRFGGAVFLRPTCARGSSRATGSKRPTRSPTRPSCRGPCAATRARPSSIVCTGCGRRSRARIPTAMAREIKMAELLEKQRSMSDKAQALINERDVDKIQRITAELEEEGRALETLARAFEKQELAKAGPPPRGKLEVVLTPAQRERVKKQTGVDMATVVVADEGGVLSKAMPYTSPQDIERLALAEARKLASLKNADGQMRAAVEQALLEIEQTGYGEVLQELERLKADPNWLGGILHAKKK